MQPVAALSAANNLKLSLSTGLGYRRAVTTRPRRWAPALVLRQPSQGLRLTDLLRGPPCPERESGADLDSALTGVPLPPR